MACYATRQGCRAVPTAPKILTQLARCSRAIARHAVLLDFGRRDRGQSFLCPGAALAPACFRSAVGKSVFPVAPVEKAARPHLGRIEIVEAAGVDAEILRIGAGNVEGMNSAMAAKGMLCDAGIESIGGEI